METELIVNQQSYEIKHHSTSSIVELRIIEDGKTNKRIRDRGYGNKKMLAPLSHLEDCEMSHYSLQLSIYQYMLEYFGFHPGVRRIIHFPHEIEGLGTPSPAEYELPYLRDEVIAMLTHLKHIGWLN